MKSLVKDLIKKYCKPLVRIVRRVRARRAERQRLDVFAYDKERFLKYAGCFDTEACESQLAAIIMAYHVLEKGLTMPRRHLNFGHANILSLIEKITKFEKCFSTFEPQVVHARGLIKAYFAIHEETSYDMTTDPDFWNRVRDFNANHPEVPVARQPNVTRDEFFASVDASFPEFARSRHTSRHYQGTVDIEKIRAAVDLAMTAPSACNRQHTRVRCVSSHDLRDRLFAIQNGNRGFGSDADKILVITGDLADIQYIEERNDLYVNVGIFIMNLCYALHCQKIAHCILNWHMNREGDLKARELLQIPSSETIVAVIACGNPPDSFDICESPKRSGLSIFTEHN